MDKKYFALFVSQHLYFLPQFYPIALELKKRNRDFLILLMCKDLEYQNQVAIDFCIDNGFEYKLFKEEDEPILCKFMINGGNKFPVFDINYDYSVSIVHGIGTKSGYYSDILNNHDIRFIEGQKRVDRIKELFPDTKCNLYNVGFAKLDTAIKIIKEDKEYYFKKYNLDLSKKTLLYAPTFYPSSIENMPNNFPELFKDLNIIVKPHFFSLQRKKYKHHLKKFALWKQYNNVFFADAEDFDLCPFMAVSDIMLTDESSAIFEFAALNKPVIINRDIRYRLSYRIFKSKIKKRLDSNMDIYRKVGIEILDSSFIHEVVMNELEHINNKEKERKEVTEQIVGKVDGKVSLRICDILEKY
ncbi:CDP-glycerol glycerophosphotransferase family protein [Labilibacter marinus]|uniref:CDP-glycerol glycerophosphotransferase family protein n=1 Tax=Labilibacter marinus TaxID=1477105 RepID=UPI000830550D|nr:CDP-glycerol glycerophosphotransferase family protein [Labilibacter marinus]